MKSFLEYRVDQVGILLSVLCALHCLSFPLFYIAGVQFFEFHSLSAHMLFFVSVSGIALWSFIRCYRSHGFRVPLLLGLSGILLLLLGIVLEAYQVHLLETSFDLLTILGSACLVFAHLKNLRLCRCLHSAARCAH